MQLGEDSTSSESDMLAQKEQQRPTRRRKALSRWPPYGLSTGISGMGSERFAKPTRLEIALPWVRFFPRLPSENFHPSSSSYESSEGVREGLATSKPNSRKLGTEYSSVLVTQSRDMVNIMLAGCL